MCVVYPLSRQVGFVTSLVWEWPNATISFWATSTLLHVEQCFPSLKPVCVHVGAIALSITSVCPNSAT